MKLGESVLDQLLHPIRDKHISPLILVPDVTRLEELVFSDGRSRCFGIVVISQEDVGALDPDFAFFACGYFNAICGHEFDDLVGKRWTAGAEAVVPLFLCWVEC